MSLAYYANEIPLAKRIIRNYLIFRCNDDFWGKAFVSHLRRTRHNHIINFYQNDLLMQSYKQYLDCLEYFSYNKKPVSATVFKRLLAKEKRILHLVRGSVKDEDYMMRVANTYEVIEVIQAQENSEHRL